jgi:transposase InsO family protein
VGILKILGISSSSWYYRKQDKSQQRKRGPKPKEISKEALEVVLSKTDGNPWYGYKRIAVMCRRSGLSISDRQVYRIMKEHGLLHRRRPRGPELHQAAKLYELLPKQVNDLWQADVTYIHIPGFGWWYAITVIDYYSRYLLALHLSPGYSARDCVDALTIAREEAERIHGPLTKPVILVTDNGSSFVAKRFQKELKQLNLSHVRIKYRTPTQLGLLERFHGTLKREEVYWNLYDNPAHARDCLKVFKNRYNQIRPHWALVPEGGGDPGTPDEVYRECFEPEIPRWQHWARRAKDELDRLLMAS